MLIDPTTRDFDLAMEISSNGNRQAGYPDWEDSIYHAVAINRGHTFVTADSRHVSKASAFGHVLLLADWRA